MNIRPRRSVLYMPGSNQRALEKARGLMADTLVLDLEDSVSPESKDSARQQILIAIREGGYGHRELVVRVNSLDTEWGEEDIRIMAASGADAICLSKVESAAEIEEAVRILEEANAPESLGLWIMAETCRGILNINEMVAAHSRLSVVLMGTSDLAKELRLAHSDDRAGLLPFLSQCVLAARANGLDIIDGVFIDLSDEEGFRASCEQATLLGFDGKSVIHPKQLAAANEIFAPSDNDIAQAKKIIAGWQQAADQGSAVTLVDDKLVESLHVDVARRELLIAEAIASIQ